MVSHRQVLGRFIPYGSVTRSGPEQPPHAGEILSSREDGACLLFLVAGREGVWRRCGMITLGSLYSLGLALCSLTLNPSMAPCPQNKARLPTESLPSPAPGSPHTPPHLMGQTLPSLVLGLHCSLCLYSPSGQLLPSTLRSNALIFHEQNEQTAAFPQAPTGLRPLRLPQARFSTSMPPRGKILSVESSPLSRALDTGVCIAGCVFVCIVTEGV